MHARNVNGGGRAMPAASVVAALRSRRALTRFAQGCYGKGPHRGSALQSQDNTIDWVTRARELVPVIAAGADRAERDRRILEEVVGAIGDAGLLRMLLPA